MCAWGWFERRVDLGPRFFSMSPQINRDFWLWNVWASDMFLSWGGVGVVLYTCFILGYGLVVGLVFFFLNF
jgi:hypothetical protein